MTDTPHFTEMQAYEAVYESRHVHSCWMHHPEIAEQDMKHTSDFYIEGDVDFSVLAEHINAAITKAVKAEREACAEEAIARGERNKYCPPGCRCADPWHIAAYIRARGAK